MAGAVVGVASERDVLIIQCDRAAGSRGPLGWPDLLALLDAHGVAGKQLHVDGSRLALVVSRENLHEEERVRRALADRFGDASRVTDALGAVSVVGAGINASFANVRRGTEALAELGAAVDGLATSSFRITWMIERARLDDAVRRLHAVFIERQRQPVP
jgi:aspartate kinase